MKLISTTTKIFKKGRRYPIEDTVCYPSQYFRKSETLKEDPARKYTQLIDGDVDELSDFDICIKSFKVVEKWYE